VTSVPDSGFDPFLALDPNRSAVVEACAGSGKTWLLVSRMLRLLLAGAEPSSLLAITFTRAAAREMQERLNDWLHRLATARDDEAIAFLSERGLSETAARNALPNARTLYARVLLAVPGPTLTTFHGWFLDIIRRAPLSTGFYGQAELLEQTRQWQDKAWLAFAEGLRDQPHSPEAQALDWLLEDVGLDSTHRLTMNFLRKRGEWLAWASGRGDPVSEALEELRSLLRVNEEEDVLMPHFGNDLLRTKLTRYGGYLARSAPADTKLAAVLASALAEPRPEAWFEGICSVVLTQSGELRLRNTNKAQADRLTPEGESGFLRLHEEIGATVVALRESLTAQRILRYNAAGLAVGSAVLARYTAMKEARGTMDFADLEWLALKLLADSDQAEYLQYRMDRRYKHILLDEFQDTNPLQWRILRAWLDAYGAGQDKPTVFLVGDPKQSIYRFRRADARLFDVASDYLRVRFDAYHLAQNETRRNAPAVLALINGIFSGQPDYPHFSKQTTLAASRPGCVECIAITKPPTPEPIPWRNPLQQPAPQTSPELRAQARAVAEKIQSIVGRWQIEDGDRTRSARYGDILILTRSRTGLEHFEYELEASGIPFLSSRKGALLDAPECRDLAALLGVLVNPRSDLDLAHVLKSPVFSCSDEDLMLLSGYADAPWRARLGMLCGSGSAGAALERAHRLLSGWQGVASHLPAHDLLDRIYYEGDVPRRFAAAVPPALVPGVNANLNAFLRLALEIDAGRYPSLPRFLDTLRDLHRGADDEAPDAGPPDNIGDVVRIETIHGAKGLEFPIVMLIKADRPESPERGHDVLIDWPADAERPSHFSLYAKKGERGAARMPIFEAEAALARREELNLLYVAFTRARQGLILFGMEDAGAESAFGLARAAPRDESAPALQVRDLESAVQAFPQKPDPAFISRTPAVGSRKTPDSDAARRGIRLHRLMQWLTDRSDGDPPETGYGEDAELLAMARRVLENPELARFFDPRRHLRALNEQACVVDGEICRFDRLVEFEDEIWVLDYKSGGENEPDPARRGAPHAAQLTAYRRAVSRIRPDKPVHSGLIFGDGEFLEMTDG
jgi:ATP-dependent helicase/nuclease subunit A